MPRAAARPADVAPKPATTARTAAATRRRAAAAPVSAKPSARQPAVAPVPAAKPAPAEKIDKADKSLKTGPVDRSEKAGKATKEVKAEKTDKLDRIDKPAKPRIRMVRDSFTMPEADFALIGQLKAAAVAMGRPAKKSELLRAGLRLLAAQPAKALLGALDGLEPVKLGRPKQGG